jgi:hypothetical protein
MKKSVNLGVDRGRVGVPCGKKEQGKSEFWRRYERMLKTEMRGKYLRNQ